MIKRNYLICGSLGWCLEIFWSGLHSFAIKDYHLMGQSSLWMFPIYGMGAFIGPISRRMCHYPFYIRGLLYTEAIFLIEYLTGSILTYFSVCPWDYSQAALNYKGLIRLDYAPLWFITGLLFEKIMCRSS